MKESVQARHRRLSWLEAACWMMVLLCFGFVGVTALRAARAKGEAVTRFSGLTMPVSGQSGAVGKSGDPLVTEEAGASDSFQVEGRIEIEAIHLSAPIVTGCSAGALRLGSCHLPGTAVAGGLGNMALAGHRDGVFRPLRLVRAGQTVEIFGREGHFRYVVDRTEVVTPEDTAVLAVGERPELTLITCFPFQYVGTAPKRFVVHAHLLFVDGMPQG